jgi:predicted DNA-binding transcriptional regulator YafY
MLNKEELAAFLSLFLAFATTNGLSAHKMSEMFGVSVPTLSRWLNRARGLHTSASENTYIYRHLAEPIRGKIEKLNELDEARGIYAALDGYSVAKKVELLQGALAGRIV